MHSAARIVLLVLALAAWAAAADLPKKAPLTKYTGLWTNSPFTSKPPPPETGPVVNPLEDYALAGVSPVRSGYRVTLLNKKKPEERITVDSDNLKSDFKILKVTRKAGDPLGTVVLMQSGTVKGPVTFDEKLLALAAPPAPKVPAAATAPGQPGQPQLGQPGQPQPGQPGQSRQPRPRVVPPPAITPPGAAAAGQPQPGQPGQPVQPATMTNPSHSNSTRPSHRGRN